MKVFNSSVVNKKPETALRIQTSESCLWFYFTRNQLLNLKVLHALGQLVSDPLQLVGAVIHLSESIQNLLCLGIGLLRTIHIVMCNLRKSLHGFHDLSTGLSQSAGTLSDLQDTLHGIFNLLQYL